MSGSRHILVALDGTAASERVAAFVNDFFAEIPVRVTAVNVGGIPIEWGPRVAMPGLVYAWPYAVVWPPESAVEDGGVDASLQRAERTLARSDIQADEELVEFGDVAETVREVAADRDVDLIVVGTEHRGLLDRLLSPSVSVALAKSAPRPVLVVH